MTRLQRSIAIIVSCCALWPAATLPAQTLPRTSSTPLRPAYQPLQSLQGNAIRADEPATAAAPLHVSLVGAVAAPATYLLPRPLTCSEFIDAAGGPADDHSNSILLVRQGRLNTLLYDSKRESADAFGQLQEGDVVVLRAQPGVRRAVYETTSPLSASGRPGDRVTNPHRDVFVHVACIGLAPHPVVLPLNPYQATQHALLKEMLGMSDEAIQTGCRVLTDGGRFINDGSLQDGTVILFDLRRLPADAVRPIERYPAARELPAPATEAPGGLLQDSSAAPLAPARPSIVDHVSAPFAREAMPSSAPLQTESTATAPAVGRQQHLLNQPLYVPGLPFECFDRQRGAEPDARATAAPLLSAVAPIPAAAIDITEPDSYSGRSTGRTVQISAGVPVSEPAPRGLRATVAAPPVSYTPVRGIEIEGETAAASSEMAAVGAASEGWRVLRPIAAATGAAVLIGLLGFFLWLSARRMPQRNTTTMDRPLAPPAHGPAPTAAAAPLSPLQELLEQRLPLIEEPAIPEPGVRLHGPILGHRKLFFDPPHAAVGTPHFSPRAASTETSTTGRLERHVAAVRRAREPIGAAVVAATTPSVAGQASGLAAVAYDVVQPEPVVPTPLPPRPVSPPRMPQPRSAPSEDLLTRVLTSLEEDRS